MRAPLLLLCAVLATVVVLGAAGLLGRLSGLGASERALVMPWSGRP